MGRRKQCMKTMDIDEEFIITETTTRLTMTKDNRAKEVAKNCYICSHAVSGGCDDARGQDETKIDVFINALCEICEMSIESVLEAANDDKTVLNLNRIVFCDACQINLHKFKEIKSALQLLKQELSQVQVLISTAFLAKPLQQASDNLSSVSAECLTTEVCPETATEDLEVEEFKEKDTYDEIFIEVQPTSDAEDVDSRDPDWDPLSNYPQLHHNDNYGLRKQKSRLRALLKRQKSKRTMKKPLHTSKTDRSRRKNLHPGNSLYKFPCPNCPRKLPTEEMLRYHVRKNHEQHPTPYYCQNCDSQFQRLGELRKHIRRACQAEPSEPIHSRKAQEPRLLKKSIRRITYKFTCPKPNCCRKTPTAEFLRFHIRKIHEKNPTPFDCQTCDKQFERLADLRKHTDQRTCQLTESSKPPSNSGADDSATAEIPGSRDDPNASVIDTITCKDCGGVYKTEVGFDNHLKRQGGQCTREQQIPRSEWKGPLNSRYDVTQKKIHRYVCGACGKKYRSTYRLAIHLRAVHTDGFAFLCEFCCKPFNSLGSLKGHQRVMHLEEFLASQTDATVELERIRNRTCSFCKMVLTTTGAKRDHEARHTNSFQYFCEVCGSGWPTLNELKSHSRVHQEKKYKCDECGHTFAQISRRDRHMRAKHGLGDKAKPFKCEFCDKRFWERTHMKRHIILIHTKPESKETSGFGCDLCSYKCAIREYILIHSKTKKHMQKVEALGLTDRNTGIKFPESKGLVRRCYKQPDSNKVKD